MWWQLAQETSKSLGGLHGAVVGHNVTQHYQDMQM